MKSALTRLALPLLAAATVATASAAGLDPVCIEGCQNSYQRCLVTTRDDPDCYQAFRHCLLRCTTGQPLADEDIGIRHSTILACTQADRPIWRLQ